MYRIKGFSLIELMIAVAIIGILATIAYPSYVDYVAKGARAEGLTILADAANLQEQFYFDNRTYTGNMSDLGFDANPFITDGENYSVSATIVGTGTFKVKATAKGAQATRDSSCGVLQITETGEKTPKGCW
ncbi:prepilin-type cleavage/methylation domain-containing protein [Shewanella sp. GutCb]|uniref:type IV pilin protein n=1 Tax=Shewanella sp. GutCb TaxID=2058315 RepID=UPI000C7D3C22|nr:type IV pilin protein [Shewanella sp. GutCb]PKG76413.1 prepilin-type cleavage/methylation domain-containing protein [Shewanella sp. GutCb]